MLIATLYFTTFRHTKLKWEKSAAKFHKHTASGALKYCRSRIS